MSKQMIYIASPYTKGDPALNVKTQIDWFTILLERGFIPFAPLLCHFVHLVHPAEYPVWMSYDLGMLERCDAVLSINSIHSEIGYCETRSSGRDAEVKFAIDLEIPVFRDLDSLENWRDEKEIE